MTTTANGLLYGLGVQNCDELPTDNQGFPILKGQVEKTSINLHQNWFVHQSFPAESTHTLGATARELESPCKVAASAILTSAAAESAVPFPRSRSSKPLS
jgi:hypothetical protein